MDTIHNLFEGLKGTSELVLELEQNYISHIGKGSFTNLAGEDNMKDDHQLLDEALAIYNTGKVRWVLPILYSFSCPKFKRFSI